MITKKQQQQIKSFKDEWGIDTHQRILFGILNHNNLIRPDEHCGVILDILLNEEFPQEDDENFGSVTDYYMLECEPEIVRNIVDKNYEQYEIGF